MNALVEPSAHLGRLGWHGHLLLLHRSEQERRTALADWAQCGIERGAKIFYTEHESEPRHRQFRSVLSQAGVNTDVAAATGQLQVLPLSEFYRPGRQRQLIEESRSQGYPAVQLSSEIDSATAWLLDHQCTVEPPFADGGSRYPVSALCQHDAPSLTGRRLDEVVALHPDGVREQLMISERTDDGIALTGEIDMSNSHLLASVLRTACGWAGPDRAACAWAGHAGTGCTRPATLRIDLSRVEFIDVRGIRAIVQASEAHRRCGGSLLLITQRQCRRMLHTLNVDRLPNVALRGSEG